jgi:hypothetical protein
VTPSSIVFHSSRLVPSWNGTCEREAVRVIIYAPAGPPKKTQTKVSNAARLEPNSEPLGNEKRKEARTLLLPPSVERLPDACLRQR